MFLSLPGLYGHVKVNVVVSPVLHFVVDGTCYDVPVRVKGAGHTLHELFTVHRTEHGTVSTHGFGNQERRTVARMIERCRVNCTNSMSFTVPLAR